MEAPRKLVIIQVNLKQSPSRQRSLFEYISVAEHVPDIIAIQDPPFRIPWQSCSPYRLDYRSSRPLTEDDDPRELRVSLSRVCFLVHESISEDKWYVQYHGSLNQGLSTTLFLNDTSDSPIAIHNVYNPNASLDLDQLFRDTTTTTRDVLLGDFNLHHPHWGGSRVGANATDGRALYEGVVEAADMVCVTPPGTITYSRSTATERYASTIDLTFVSQGLANDVRHCKVLDVPGFQSDHRPIETIIDIHVFRDNTRRYRWKKIRRRQFCKAVGQTLERLGLPPLATSLDIDNYAKAIQAAIEDSVAKSVPKSGLKVHRRPRRFLDPVVLDLRAQERAAWARWGLSRNSRYLRHCKRKSLEREHAERRSRTKGYRSFVTSKARRPMGIWRLATMGRRIRQPKEPCHLPTLKADGIEYKTEAEKAYCLRQSTWSKTSDGDSAPVLPFPPLPPPPSDPPPPEPSRAEHEINDCPEVAKVSPAKVSPTKLSRVIDRLPKGKAGGPDEMANEALKAAKAELVPALAHLFEACLKLGHHPSIFKHATTVIVRKKGKEDYTIPNSYRPIALLSCVGKLLEKIVAEHLKSLVIEHNLLPNTQYGVSGKCTTKALQFLLSSVYRGFDLKMMLTLMSLDIKGAFNAVDREKLLKILIEKGVPDWIIRFIWSFLSDRSTTLKLPGSTEDKFWVDIGIPQGSPLSPLLFLFFASPILEKTSQDLGLPSGTTITAFAYMDDTYILVQSTRYEDNCAALEKCHKTIMEWANEVHIEFSPEKFKVMHFQLPGTRKPRCTLLPNIAGIRNDEKHPNPAPNMKVLGVKIDHRLNWTSHVDYTVKKVLRSKRFLNAISGSTWGPTLWHLRQIYVTKIRPIIFYACGAWALVSDVNLRWRFTKRNMEKLQNLQRNCLLQISGAIIRTPRQMLEKELDIDTVQAFFIRMILSQRAKAICDSGRAHFTQEPPPSQHPVGRRPLPYDALDMNAWGLLKKAKDHLIKYHGADVAAQKWLQRKTRNRAINTCARREAAIQNAREWDDYRRHRAQRHEDLPLVVREDWGSQSLRSYRGLTRAQSTILLHCRTEVIGLDSMLFDRKLALTARCSCGARRQTAFHMFIECRNLLEPRDLLAQRVGHLDFKTLMTKDSSIAADWAISYFDLGQFAGARKESSFGDPSKPPVTSC